MLVNKIDGWFVKYPKFLKGLIFFLFSFYFLLFSYLSITKHLSLHSTYLDLGLESQIVWNTSKGRFLETSFGHEGSLISALSFHVSPISALLSPFYWIWSDPITLLLLQTFVLSLGGLPVYWLALKVTESPLVSLVLLSSYFLYPPLQYSNLSDFHPQTLSTTILLFSFWFLFNKDFRKFYLTVLLGLFVKENIALVFSLLSFYVIFGMREVKKGAVLLIVSLFWFVFSVYLIMPSLSGGSMGAFSRYEYLGKTPLEAVWTLLSRPFLGFQLLFITAKVKYIFHLLVSVGFLSLLAPGYLLLSASELFLNLFSSYNPQWQVKFHYTAAVTPFIFISSIFGIRKLLNFFNNRNFKGSIYLVSFYLIFVAFSWNMIHSPSPINYKFDRLLFAQSTTSRQIIKILREIPPEASVSAMNNLGPHLSTRRYLYNFPTNFELADFVIIDPKMPYESFDLAQVKVEQLENYLKVLKDGKTYRQTVNLERLSVFKRVK